MIGAYISEFDLRGSDRANYGDRLLSELSRELRSHKISNTGRRQLYSYLTFYRAYPQKVRTVPAQLAILPEKLEGSLSYSHFELIVALDDDLKRTFYEIVGALVDRTHKDFSEEEIDKVATTYHAWRGEKDAGEYRDVPGFCKSASTGEIKEHGYVLTPGRYVGAAEIEDDGIPFEEKMAGLSATLYEQFAEADRLEAVIKKNLEVLGYGVE